MATLCLLVNINLLDILSWLKGEPVSYSGTSPLSPIYSKVLTWAPGVILLIILIVRIKKGPQIKVGFYFLGTVLPGILLAGFILLGPPFENYMNQEEFNDTLWRTHVKDPEDFMWPNKLKMVDSLLESKILDGLNRKEVIKLLGPPTSDTSPEHKKQDEIYYYLGPERGFIRIDSEWLSISFDENGKVKKYWLWRD